MFAVNIIYARAYVPGDAGWQRRWFSGGWQPPQYLVELVVARVPGLKGSPDNWLKGLSLLTLLGPPANASRIIKSFLEPSLANAATGCRETQVPRSLSPLLLHDSVIPVAE
jgi:hypothetical protein